MHIAAPPHAWNVTPSEAIAVQKELRKSVKTDVSLALESVRIVAGVDVSSSYRGDPLLTAGIILWDRIENRVIETASFQAETTFPYIPGLLSFREIPILLSVVEKLTREPDVWLVDGHGIAHPRRLGIAAHFGVVIDRPTIGVAKSKLTGAFTEPLQDAGAESPLMDKTERIGTVLRTKPRSNPLFLSPGHKIDEPSAVAIVRACLRGYRLPEPTRLAHEYVNEVRRQSLGPAIPAMLG